MSCQRQQIQSSGWAPQVRVCTHMPVSHVHISFSLLLFPLFSTRLVSFLRSGQRQQSLVHLSTRQTLAHIWLTISLPGALSFVYTWLSGSNLASAAPAMVETAALYIWFASPYVQKFLPRGEVQVSAGEVYISTVLPD